MKYKFPAFIFSAIIFSSDIYAAGVRGDAGLTKKIMAGQIVFKDVQEQSVSGVEATFLLRTSSDKLWNILTDYKNYGQNFENIKEIKVINEDIAGATIELWISTVVKTFHYTAYRKYEEPLHRLSWHKVSGDFKTNHGSWEILDTEDGNACIVVYRSFVEVDGFIGTAFKGMTKPESVKRINRMVGKLKTILEKKV